MRWLKRRGKDADANAVEEASAAPADAIADAAESGEQPISAVAPAIVNAVLDAVGVSIPDLPITSEKVYRALQARLIGA